MRLEIFPIMVETIILSIHGYIMRHGPFPDDDWNHYFLYPWVKVSEYVMRLEIFPMMVGAIILSIHGYVMMPGLFPNDDWSHYFLYLSMGWCQ